MNKSPIYLVNTGWSQELIDAIRADKSSVHIICPFIKVGVVERLELEKLGSKVKVITRFNLSEFSAGVSDIEALGLLLEAGAEIRGIQNLHAKIYIFGESRAIITSANLTKAALDFNQEFGLVAGDTAIISECQSYFDRLWEFGKFNLSKKMLDEWTTIVDNHRTSGGSPMQTDNLVDFGKYANLDASLGNQSPAVTDAKQAFVKLVGSSVDRVSVFYNIADDIESGGFHRLAAYHKRPNRIKQNSVIFWARFTNEPDDLRVFGRAIAMPYIEEDNATEDDIRDRDWLKRRNRYVRLHHAEFVAGNMENGISLNELMDNLGSEFFGSTQENAENGEGNTNPRHAYRQAEDVRLSERGLHYLNRRLEEAFQKFGRVPQDWLDRLAWP